LWVCNIPIECEGCKWIYERSYFWTVEKNMNLWSFIYSFASFTFYGYITNSQSDQLLVAWRTLYRYRRGYGLESRSGLN